MKRSYLFLDAARGGYKAILSANEAVVTLEHDCLYTHPEERKLLQEVAPYLYAADAALLNWFALNGWGNAWGWLFESALDFNSCLQHFRQFILAQKAGGDKMFFRFYDPRVLKAFLPVCDRKQITDFFGPVQRILLEGDTKELAMEFTQADGMLKQRVLQASAVVGLPPAAASEPAEEVRARRRIIIEDDLAGPRNIN